jgi:hypothetical protein
MLVDSVEQLSAVTFAVSRVAFEHNHFLAESLLLSLTSSDSFFLELWKKESAALMDDLPLPRLL